MAKGFKHGSGSLPLNFKVVGNPQPTNPKENTIWLDTNDKITVWYFSTTQPENMQPGEFWFSTEKSSNAEFNALKKNNLTVYPVSAWHMTDEGLVAVPCKCYQNGSWVELWDGTLFDKGNQYEIFTGGWEADRCTHGKTNASGLTKIGDTLLIDVTNSSERYSSVSTKKKIDLTPFRTLKFNVTSVKVNGSAACNVYIHTLETCDLLTNNLGGYTFAAVGEHSMDVSNFNEECYISFGINSLRKGEVDMVRLVR